MSAPIELSRTVRPASAFVHPLFLGSLALLALNDRVLKGSGLLPGWLTGKLSDFAGLISPRRCSPRCWACDRGVASRSRPGPWASGSPSSKLSGSATALAEAAYAAFGLTWRSWSDPTDLLALAMLPVSYALVVRTSLEVPARATRARAEILFGAAGVFASVATSTTMEPTTCTSETFDCDADGWGTPDDCDDYDPSTAFPGQGCLSSGAESVCDDGVDQDGDGATDCDDLDCSFACADLQAVCGALVPDQSRHHDGARRLDRSRHQRDGRDVHRRRRARGPLPGPIRPRRNPHDRRPRGPRRPRSQLVPRGPHRGIVCAAPGEPAPTVTVSVEPNVHGRRRGRGRPALRAVPGTPDVRGRGVRRARRRHCAHRRLEHQHVRLRPRSRGLELQLGGPIASRRTFEIVPTASGTLSVVASSPADVVLSARTACDVASELACSDDAGVGSLESLTVPTVGGTPVYVVVERIGGDGVDLTLTTTLTRPDRRNR